MGEDVVLPGDDDLWVIQITGGYGSFLFRGNEDDAEFMRASKAQWESANGHKWRLDDETYGNAPSGVRGNRKQATAQAQESAKLLMHVPNWRNYGRSPASEKAIAALGLNSPQAHSPQDDTLKGINP